MIMPSCIFSYKDCKPFFWWSLIGKKSIKTSSAKISFAMKVNNWTGPDGNTFLQNKIFRKKFVKWKYFQLFLSLFANLILLIWIFFYFHITLNLTHFSYFRKTYWISQLCFKKQKPFKILSVFLWKKRYFQWGLLNYLGI